MRDRANPAGLLRRAYDVGQRQIGREGAAQLDDQLGCFRQVWNVPLIDRRGKHMERPERTSRSDPFQRWQWFAIRFDASRGVGGVFLKLQVDLVH